VVVAIGGSLLLAGIVIMIGLSGEDAGPAAFRWSIAGIMLASFVFLVACYGGLTVRVTRERVELRLGVFGIRLLRVAVDDVTRVQVHSFSPLRDYGGWGIRWSPRGWAFFLRGNRGALIETVRGRRYLLGSDNPDRLAAVIEAATKARHATQEPSVEGRQ
jgi:hypothetical protein